MYHICKKESCIISDHVTRVVLDCTWCGVQVERVVHADLTGRGEENRRLIRIRRGYNLQRQSLSTSLPLNGRDPPSPSKQAVGLSLATTARGPRVDYSFSGGEGGGAPCLLSKGWWLWSVSRVELGVYKARRPGPSQSFTGLPAQYTHQTWRPLWVFHGLELVRCSRGV